MLIQVHDELVFNVIKSELEEVKQIVKRYYGKYIYFEGSIKSRY